MTAGQRVQEFITALDESPTGRIEYIASVGDHRLTRSDLLTLIDQAEALSTAAPAAHQMIEEHIHD